MLRRSTWIILGLFLLLLAGVYWQQRQQASATPGVTPTAASEVFLFPDSASINSLRVEHVGSQTIEAARNPQGKWQLSWPQAPATDSGALDTAVTQLGQLTPLSLMTTPPTLQAAGLDKPTYRLLAGYTDGRQVILNVGKPSPVGGSYYVLVTGKGVFVVSSYGLDPVLNLADNPPVALPASETAPAQTPAP
jgi:hypothetical protein